MTRYGHLFGLRVKHAFDGATQPTRCLLPQPVAPAVLDRHRLVVRATAGSLRAGAPLGPDDRPRFGLPPWIDVALVADDGTASAVTRWPDPLIAERPAELSGVRRHSLPWYRAHIEPGAEVIAAEPASAPTFVARGIPSLAVATDAALQVRLVDGHEETHVDRSERPDAQGKVVLRVDPAGRPADRWALSVGSTTHHVYGAELPDRTVAVVRLSLAADAPLPGPSVELNLVVRAENWTWHIIPRDPADLAADRYAIEHDTLAVSGATTTMVGDRIGLAFTSTTPIPWQAQPQGAFALWFTRADATRRLLVEQLPTPSPRALRPAVDVYL